MTTPDFSIRSADEAKTYELFATYRSDLTARGLPLETAVIAVENAFCASHMSALTVARITQIAEALSGYAPGSFPSDFVRSALTKLVRAKVLRSRTAQGVRLWEVNY